MPSPGDPINLQPNLATLAQLVKKPIGSKLSYNPSTGRFSIDEPGLIQGLIRTVYKDSVTSEEYFGRPIRELSTAMTAKKGVTGERSAMVPNRLIACKDGIDRGGRGNIAFQAINGLKALRKSYAGKPELTILNAVIEDVEAGCSLTRHP